MYKLASLLLHFLCLWNNLIFPAREYISIRSNQLQLACFYITCSCIVPLNGEKDESSQVTKAKQIRDSYACGYMFMKEYQYPQPNSVTILQCEKDIFQIS